jgi:two-component system chemotaxis response regulator CheB
MAVKRLIVIGASSGGIEALATIVAALPEGLPATVCVVVHTSPESPGILASILDRAGPLPAIHPSDGHPLKPGTIYVAPPDHHLLIEPDVARLSRGPKEHRFRPAIDPLFMSAAQVYGPRVIGIVLSGSLDDGTTGLGVIKQLGGMAIVQDPSDAQFSSMPASALRHVPVDHCLPAREIGAAVTRLVGLSVHASAAEVAHALEVEVKIAKGFDALEAGIEGIGEPSQFACPDCHGVLRALRDRTRVRYRCHTGHAYSAQSFVAACEDGIENAFWHTIRALEEADMFFRHAASGESDPDAAAELVMRADEAAAQTKALREMAMSRKSLTLARTAGDHGKHEG